MDEYVSLSLPPLCYDHDTFGPRTPSHPPTTTLSVSGTHFPTSARRSSGRPRPRNSSKTRYHVEHGASPDGRWTFNSDAINKELVISFSL